MRKLYYTFIEENDLPDYFVNLTDFPYSKKTKILKKLLEMYGRSSLIKALFEYKENYIDSGRYNYLYIGNVLKGICKKYKETEIE